MEKSCQLSGTYFCPVNRGVILHGPFVSPPALFPQRDADVALLRVITHLPQDQLTCSHPRTQSLSKRSPMPGLRNSHDLHRARNRRQICDSLLSANSEVVAAVMEFLACRQRTIARRNILVARLGQPLADQVLANVKRVGIEPVKQPRFCD